MRDALRRFASGVTVVTTRVEGRSWGMTVSAFSSVCLEPPTVLVGVRKGTVTAQSMVPGGRFGINLLTSHLIEVSRYCSAPGADKYIERFCVSPSDLPEDVWSPVISGALATLDCEFFAEHLVGDHMVAFARVRHVVLGRRAQPLVYFDRAYNECIELNVPAPAIELVW